MNLYLYPDNLIELVGKSINNPFILWPNATKEKITGFLSKTLKEESNVGRSFFFEKDKEIYLYFQIQDLPWDTQHFGYKCANIKNFYIDEEITFGNVDEIKKQILPAFEIFLKREKIRFLSADIASLSKNGNYFIQTLGFRFILNWIDGIWIPKPFGKADSVLPVSNILPAEVDMFSKIASTSYYKEGRFYIDKKFDPFKADKLYCELIKNSFLSKDIILLCRDGNTPIGIFVCKQIKTYTDFNNLKVAHLRFFLVDPAYRGKSYGERIFRSTLEYLKNECDLITSGLESHNLISMNLHSKMNFKFTYSHNAFHFWNSY
ncbi:MAG TPA: GNAT family N-acetyltransferase [Ignavibacteria bacterium]